MAKYAHSTSCGLRSTTVRKVNSFWHWFKVNSNAFILPLVYHLGVNNKSVIALSQIKGVHFGKTSGRSTPRRSSSRSIKRKKFDDELVESSLKNPGKPLGIPEVAEGKEKLKKVWK
jgi:hypothetical protein